MINHYSYKISRNDANKKKLSDEDILKNNENNFKDMLEDFLKVWKKIQKYNTQYKCHHKMEELILHEKMPLSNFLIDDVEEGKDMYLASGYENFIKWQNDFLEPISKSLDFNKNSVLNYFNNNTKNRIDVQEANQNEIISRDFSENSLYINFMHLICLNSLRNIFFKFENSNEYDNNKINYLNYNNFLYDFDYIEEEMGKILLTGKRMFNKENIKFITYSYEGFRGEKSSILVTFTELYKPIKLEDEEKKQLYDYVKEKTQYIKYDFSQIMSQMQFIIYYLTKELKEKSALINDIINEMPEYVNIDNESKNFFKLFSKISIEKLYELFSFFELLSYDVVSKNLKEEYKIDLDKNTKERIKNYFNDGVQKKIEKHILANACRKLISRYLISNEFNPDNLLSNYIDKKEFWDFDLFKHELFVLELENIKKFNIYIKHAFKLCLLLDPDNILLANIIKEIPKKMKDGKENEFYDDENDFDEEKKSNSSESNEENESDEEGKKKKKKNKKKKGKKKRKV